MRLFYSRTDLGPDGYENRNPRCFVEAEADATHVVVDGDFPDIVEAYRAMGVSVERMVEPGGAAPPVFVVETQAVPTVEERDRVFIPGDWRLLPWAAKADAMSLRQLAALVADVPVLNKTMAVAAIEAELARRAAVE